MKVEEKKVIGIVVETTNKNRTILKDIRDLWDKFLSEDISSQIPNKINPNIALRLYYDYTNTSSFENYSYKFAICQEVSSLKEIPEGMVGFTIPKSKYEVLEFQMKKTVTSIFNRYMYGYQEMMEDLGEDPSLNRNRSFTFDYELYDLTSYNSEDPKLFKVDVYVALK